MSIYAITETVDGDALYLNHAYLVSLSFGSEDMAWTTNDKEKADLMLEKVLNSGREFAKIVEY